MCGIVGIMTSGASVDPHRLQRAAESLRSRGPDGDGSWYSADRRVALAHRRLAVVGVDDGAQPIRSEDGRVIATVNGEFYDHREIRRDLVRRGHRFRTESDSEVLVHLYEEHGIDCLQYLRGEFAFALWDATRERLFAARDRFGVKPLVWSRTPNALLLASKACALFELGVEPRWNVDAVYNSFSHQYASPSQTLFAGVETLRPGCFMTAVTDHVRVERYHDLDFPPEGGLGADAPSAEELLEALDDSVRLRLEADVPVACLLSGGLDSSTVAALAARRARGPLRCFGVVFPGAELYDEESHARATAEYIGARYTPLAVSVDALRDALPDSVAFAEGLAINAHLPAKFLLSRHVRDAGYHVVLTGEGADEWLLGYPHLIGDWLDCDDEPARRALRETHAFSSEIMLAGTTADDAALRGVADRLGYTPNFLRAKRAMGRRVGRLLTDATRSHLTDTDRLAGLLDQFDYAGQLRGRHPVHQSAYLWARTALAVYILTTLGDGTEMAHSVEGRPPFLDRRVQAVARRIRPDRQIRGTSGTSKHVLREAARGLVPERVRERPKHPFLAPPLATHPAARDLVGDMLSSRPVREARFVDPDAALEVLGRLDEMPADMRRSYEPPLMMALSLAILQHRFNPTRP